MAYKLHPVSSYSNFTEAKFIVTIIHVKNSNIYKRKYSDKLILVYQFLLLKRTKKSKTNVNYCNSPPQITKIE